MNVFRRVLIRGILVRSCHHHNVYYRDRSWESGNLGQRTLESLITTECFNSWIFKPSEIPSRTLTWKPLDYLSHIKCHSNDDRFSVSQWESLIWSRLDVPTPALLGPDQQCACNACAYDTLGDHLQTCETKSEVSQVHDWVVYKLGTFHGSVGHRFVFLLFSVSLVYSHILRVNDSLSTVTKSLGDLSRASEKRARKDKWSTRRTSTSHTEYYENGNQPSFHP
jgi:hypothetical protein